MKPAECSTELVIDSIVLNTDVLHSIRNNLPVPVEHLVVQKIPKAVKQSRTGFIIVCMFSVLIGIVMFGFSLLR